MFTFYKANNLKKSRFIKNVILNLALAVFIICGIILIRITLVDTVKNNADMDEIQKLIYGETIGENSEIESLEFREKRVDGLINIDSSIKGWIKMKNTPIDYPVVQNRSDADFYLYKNYKKENSRYGSIFVDSKCDLEKGCKNILLHGHSMNNGTMFRSLIELTELDFYKTTPTFTYDMPGKIADWKIISVFRTNTLEEHGEIFEYLRPSFSCDEEFLNYVYQVKIRSLINIPVDVNENDELITLSTCSYEMKDFRTVIVARKVRNGESTEVDVDKASWANHPVLPEAYYSVYKSNKPVNVTNFKDALKKGEINWYSGTKFN